MIRSALVTTVGVLLLVFLAIRLVPGDPVDLMLGEQATSAQRDELRAELALDRPLTAQLASYLGGLARGNLGLSVTRHKPVARLIASALPYTALLALCATLFANLIGVPLGVLAAARARAPAGRAIFWGASLLVALPSFWLAPLLVLGFSLRWPWLPVSSFEHWSGLVLPTASMGFGLAAYLCQTTRAAVSEVLASDFVRTARAKGASETRVLFGHALPAAARPILTVSALQLGHLLAGAVIVETIFDWPGIGKLAYDALMQRDYPTVQGAVLIITITYIALNTATDALLERPS